MVANHVVTHCILGLLKDRTRIIVTEHQTLYYHANKILHVEDGKVTPSTIAHNSFSEDEPLPDEETYDALTASTDERCTDCDSSSNGSGDSVLDEVSYENCFQIHNY